MSEYNQLVVWVGVILKEAEYPSFIEQMKEEIGTRIEVRESFTTDPTPNMPDTGGRYDLIFAVHEDDISSFAIKRLQIGGMSWWEDYLDNNPNIVPEDILEKYPRTW